MKTSSPKFELKSWPEFYREIASGMKKHDLRRDDDRKFEVGDIVRIKEWDQNAEVYTGNSLLAKITYKTGVGAPCAYSRQALDPQFCILSIEVVKVERRGSDAERSGRSSHTGGSGAAKIIRKRKSANSNRARGSKDWRLSVFHHVH